MDRTKIVEGAEIAVDYWAAGRRETAAPGTDRLAKARVLSAPARGAIVVESATGPTKITARQAVCTWPEQERAAVETMNRERERREWMTKSSAERNEAATYLLDLLGPTELDDHERGVLPYWVKPDVQPHSDWSGINGGEGKVSATRLAAIAKAAFEAGVASTKQ